jgi:hypothetical protein
MTFTVAWWSWQSRLRCLPRLAPPQRCVRERRTGGPGGDEEEQEQEQEQVGKQRTMRPRHSWAVSRATSTQCRPTLHMLCVLCGPPLHGGRVIATRVYTWAFTWTVRVDVAAKGARTHENITHAHVCVPTTPCVCAPPDTRTGQALHQNQSSSFSSSSSPESTRPLLLPSSCLLPHHHRHHESCSSSPKCCS